MSKKSVLLDTFWKLSDEKENARIEAAAKILTTLTSKTKENVPDENGGGNEGKSSLTYCAERLIRGLASTRETSIQGFFICLVELLRQHSKDNEEVSIDRVLEIISKTLHVKGLKSEEGEYMRGKILCYGAIIRSGEANAEQLGTISEKLVSLSSKRSYLATPAHKIIIEGFDQLEEEDFLAHVWPKLSTALKSKPLSLELIWLLTEIHTKYPNVFNKERTKEFFERKKFISQEFIKDVADLLMESNGAVGLRPLAKLPALTKFLSEVEKEGLLDTFWLRLVEPRANKISVYKSSIAVLVLNAIVGMINDPNKLPKYFTDNMIDIYLACLSKTEVSEVETVILATFDKLIAHAGSTPSILTPILKSLLTESGNIAFDKISGSTIVQRLMAISDAETVKSVGELYLEALLGSATTYACQPTSKERAFAAHQLAKLMSHPKVHSEKEWKIKMISHIFTVTLFEVKKPVLILKNLPKPFSREARVELKPVFFKALDVKASSLETLCDVLHGVAEYTSQLLANYKAAAPMTPLEGSSLKAWKEMVEVVEKIRANKIKKKEDVVFQLLFIQLGFQIFSDPAMAVDVLADLHICYEKSHSKKKRRKSAANKTGDEEEPEWIEVVVDLLLSLLSQNKHVLRQVVGSVMTVLSPHINDGALQAIIDVVHPPKVDEDADQTVDGEEGSDDEDYETEEEEEVEEEEEEEAAEEEGDEEEVEGEDSDDDGDDEDENGDEIDDEFRDRVKTALGKHAAADSDQESIDIDDLDDEDMARMDEALSNIFRSICKKKPAGVRKKEMRDALAIMHFKIRALDMIDIYLNHNPKLGHAVFLIQPIIAALEEAVKRKDHAPLQNRLLNTLKKITNLKKLPLDENMTTETFTQVLQSLVDWGNSASPVFPMLCQPIALFSQCCSFILKNGEKLEEQNKQEPELIKIYNKALDDFFNKSHCTIPMPFFQFPLNVGCKGVLQWSDLLTEHAFATDTRPYRRTQALGLLTALLKSPALADPNNKKSVDGLLSKLVTQMKSELTQCVESKDVVKPRFLCELLNLTLAVHTADPSSTDELKDALEKMREIIPKNRHFQDVKKAFNKVGVVFNIKVITQNDKKVDKTTNGNGVTGNEEKPKQANGEAAAANVEKKKKKKKKKPSNEALKKKKERKMFEIQGQFEGQEMPSFSGIMLNENMNFSLTNGEVATEKDEEVKQKSSKKRKPEESETPVKKTKKEKKVEGGKIKKKKALE